MNLGIWLEDYTYSTLKTSFWKEFSFLQTAESRFMSVLTIQNISTADSDNVFTVNINGRYEYMSLSWNF
jgi:hypothetical protein